MKNIPGVSVRGLIWERSFLTPGESLASTPYPSGRHQWLNRRVQSTKRAVIYSCDPTGFVDNIDREVSSPRILCQIRLNCRRELRGYLDKVCAYINTENSVYRDFLSVA